MQEIKGHYTNAKIFTQDVDDTTLDQIHKMLDYVITKDTQVRIMPDCHAGKGSTVGTTIKFQEEITRVVPNIVGVDIGCGILMKKISRPKKLAFEKLDKAVQRKVPSGFSRHSYVSEVFDEALNQLRLPLTKTNVTTIRQSIGTLGGGNHYIELAKDEGNNYWLSVHSGSRNLGLQVANYYQELAVSQIEQKEGKDYPVELAYLEGQDMEDYLHDMVIAQEYAQLNRETMLATLCEAMKWEVVDSFDSIHNFINVEDKIIRKGATSAKLGERLVIPLNMREGSLICEGLGNVDWNDSAPHGAGRKMSRSKAKKTIELARYQQQMKGIYTSSVRTSTLDEAPDAYKNSKHIIEAIQETVLIKHRLQPVYNFKAH